MQKNSKSSKYEHEVGINKFFDSPRFKQVVDKYKTSNPEDCRRMFEMYDGLRENVQKQRTSLSKEIFDMNSWSVGHIEQFERTSQKDRNFRQYTCHQEMEKSRRFKNNADMAFNELSAINLAHRLQSQFEVQKQELSTELERKEIIVKAFVRKVQERDADFMKSVETYATHTDTTVQLMDQEYHKTRDLYIDKIRDFDSYMRNEFEDKRKNFKSEIESKIKKERTDEETYHSDNLINKEKELYREVCALIADRMFTFSKSKVEIEQKIQKLQMYMEMNKANIKLNQETIEYNNKVLDGRREDNDDLKDAQVKKLRILDRKVKAADEQVHKDLRNYMDKNKKLTEDLAKHTRNYKALQGKFKHFCTVDKEKFDEVWTMHEEEAKGLLDKVFQAEKSVYGQQLGLDWTAPEDVMFTHVPKDQTKEGIEEKIEQRDTAQSLLERLLVGQLANYQTNVKRIMRRLETELMWLLDEDMRLSARDPHLKDKTEMQRFSCILAALKVTTEERLQKLILHFFNKGKYELQNSVQEFDQYELDPILLLDKWKEPDNGIFDDRDSDTKSHTSKRSSNTRLTSKGNKQRTRSNRMGEERENDVKHNRELFEVNFWQDIQIPDERQRVWTYLEKGQKKYFKLLQDRQGLVEETGKLHMQNEELKTLLKQYLQANINLDLIVPPTDVIRYDEEVDI